MVYIIYAALILSIDLHPDWDIKYVDNMFVGAAVVHVINAFMYIWVWLDAGFPLRHRIMIPEFLNIIEASLYLATASMYGYEGSGEDDGSYTSSASYASSSVMTSSSMSITNTSSSSNSSSSDVWSSSSNSSSYFSSSYYSSSYYDPILHDVQAIEMTASIVEMIAAFGWVTTWYLTYQRVPGRGFTLDDPDVWAGLTILTPGVIYIAYNVQLQLDPSQYGADYLYVVADKIYMANAILYFLASLRDVGWFWFMPTAGVFPPLFSRGIVSKSENDTL